MMTPFAVIPGDSSAPLFKVFRSALGEHLLIVPHSRIFDVHTMQMGQRCPGTAGFSRGALPTPRTVRCRWTCCRTSAAEHFLNVSSSCNLSCSYCYAARGSFQGAQRNDAMEVARAAIDKLLCGADPLSRHGRFPRR